MVMCDGDRDNVILVLAEDGLLVKGLIEVEESKEADDDQSEN